MRTQGSKTFQYLVEKKTISQEKYFVSSGERKRKSPNRAFQWKVAAMLHSIGQLGVVRWQMNNLLFEELQNVQLTERAGKHGPRR
jgi:hypothetical protein